MWPHHCVVGVDGLAISIGTDSAEIVERLRPWHVEVDATVVDYALELAPTADPVRPRVRPLPRLAHGTCDLFRLRDPAELTVAFLRLLASFSTPTQPDRVRLGLMPIVHNNHALLIAADHGGRIPARWYADRSIVPYYTYSSQIDVANLTVHVDRPLTDAGSSTEPGVPLLDWWLPTANLTAELSGGTAVAQAMRFTNGIASPNVQSTLERVAMLVERHPPGLAPAAVDHVIERLHPARGAEVRHELMAQIETIFAAAAAAS